MAFVHKAQVNDSVKGGWIQFGTFTLDPASIAASDQGAETVTISGVAVGDLVFVTPQGLPADSALAGAKVTATDTLTVYINNTIDATTALDGADLTYDIMIVHKS